MASSPRSAPIGLLLLALVSFVPLGVRAETEGIDELVNALTQGSEGRRIQAAARLYHLGEGGRGVPTLLPELRSDDPDERCLVARLLGLLRSRRATAALLAASGDEDWAVRRDIAEALGQIGDPSATGRLNDLLDDPHPRVRVAAIRSLAEVGSTARLPAELRDEEDIEVRLHLVEALAADRSPPADAALARALSDPSELVRVLAASALVERGATEGVAVLSGRLHQQSTTVRCEAAAALGRATGRAADEARGPLASLLSDRSPEVALEAAASLASIGDPRGRSYLEAFSRSDAPPTLRARALELLQRAP